MLAKKERKFNMKKVGIIGASGMAGSAIYKLAEKNPNIDVVGIVRHEKKAREVLGKDADLIVGDIFDMPDSMLEHFDVIIDAFNTTPENAEEHTKLAKKLMTLAQRDDIRVIFILGAGSLHTGEDNHLVVDDIKKMPGSERWANTPIQQLHELEYIHQVDEEDKNEDADWLGISPSMDFVDGPATDYITGKDELLYNDKGESKLNSGTMAKFLIKEILDPVHHRERITIANE